MSPEEPPDQHVSQEESDLPVSPKKRAPSPQSDPLKTRAFDVKTEVFRPKRPPADAAPGAATEQCALEAPPPEPPTAPAPPPPPVRAAAATAVPVTDHTVVEGGFADYDDDEEMPF